MKGYLYVKIKDKWYHLQNFYYGIMHNGTKEYGADCMPANDLNAIYALADGNINKITKLIDVCPASAIDGKNCFLLPYVENYRVATSGRIKTYNKLIKLGFVPPKRLGKGFAASLDDKRIQILNLDAWE
jgi:hypothetical protein